MHRIDGCRGTKRYEHIQYGRSKTEKVIYEVIVWFVGSSRIFTMLRYGDEFKLPCPTALLVIWVWRSSRLVLLLPLHGCFQTLTDHFRVISRGGLFTECFVDIERVGQFCIYGSSRFGCFSILLSILFYFIFIWGICYEDIFKLVIWIYNIFYIFLYILLFVFQGHLFVRSFVPFVRSSVRSSVRHHWQTSE